MDRPALFGSHDPVHNHRARKAARLVKSHRKAFHPQLQRLEARLVLANVSVLSYHYNLPLTGVNPQETILHPGPAGDPTALNATDFGMLFSQPIDGQAYAQPLYVANLSINGTPHNVAFVATEHDSVYAFDADNYQARTPPALARQLHRPGQWHHDPADPATGTLPLDAGHFPRDRHHRHAGHRRRHQHALRRGQDQGSAQRRHATTCRSCTPWTLTTGTEKFGGPYSIGDTTMGGPGDGYANADTAIVVTGPAAEPPAAPTRSCRSARSGKPTAWPSLLLGNLVYVAFTSHADFGPYHGWIIGFDKTTLQPKKVFNTAPNAERRRPSGKAAAAISFDGTYLYFATGNGFTGPNPAFDPAHGNYSESVIKLDPTARLDPTNPR